MYILASKRNGTLYIGVTGDLVKRIWEHKKDLVEGFTKRYQVHNLVYYELTTIWSRRSPAKNRSRNGTGPGKLK
ncbi:MAG: GIY-YIG nuclease family protein [Lascolabacillus sp.]|nr:GIY-YIG nuclease family protein [Lascolabacillus sp.]